jgi:alkylhydroperoxidase/carboxymuconolactone decarboxylase family protein YurZ
VPDKRLTGKPTVAAKESGGVVRKAAAVAKKVTAKRSVAPVKKTAAPAKKTTPRKRAATPAGRTSAEEWNNPFEAMKEVAPGLLWAQNAWLAQIDSLSAPDRKTHELIRMVCSVASRNHLGIRHHAMLAGEVGATWEEVVGSIVLAGPAFGLAVVVEAFSWARTGWERGSAHTAEDE